MAGLSQASANSSSVRGWNWNMLEPHSTTKSTIWWFKTPQTLGCVCCFFWWDLCTMINHIYLGSGFNCFFHPDSCGNDPIWLAHVFRMGWFNHQLYSRIWWFKTSYLKCSSIVIPIDFLIEFFIRVLTKWKTGKYTTNNCRREMWVTVRWPFLNWPFCWSFDEGDLFETSPCCCSLLMI